MWPSPIGPPTVVHNSSSTNQNKKVSFDNSSVMVIGITYLKIGVGIYWIHLLLTVYSFQCTVCDQVYYVTFTDSCRVVHKTEPTRS